MNTSILISVVMPAFNEERWISESIQSILDQSFRDFELIIVDDGSTDKTFEIASSFEDPRVKVYRQENMGPAAARNKALSLAKGKYIALQDADDRSKPERLEKQYHYLEKHHEYIAVGTDINYLDKDGNFIADRRRPEIIPDNWNWYSPPVAHASVMFRAQVLELVGEYPNIPTSQDTLFLYKISKQGSFFNLPTVLYEYRMHPYSISRKNSQIKKIVKKIVDDFKETGELSEELVKEHKRYKERQSQQSKHYEYHLLLSKKYLWNNFNKSLTRKNSKLALSFASGKEHIYPILLILLSALGKNNAKRVYNFLNRS